MPGPTTYRDITFVTVIPSVTVNTPIPKGSRVKLYPADGTNFVTLAGATERGDYIIGHTTDPNFPQQAAAIGRGGEYFAVAAVNVAAGDALYSAANGQVTNIAAGAVYIGKAREAGLAGGLVGIILSSAA